jgi:putative hydrolase of the HAD superfamily
VIKPVSGVSGAGLRAYPPPADEGKKKGAQPGTATPPDRMPAMSGFKQGTERGPYRLPSGIRAVFLDALGTMIELEPPWVHLADELRIPLTGRVERAVRAEMSYYRAHSQEGRDPASLDDLRRRCAEVLSTELGREVAVDAMMASIRFRAYPDVAPALRALRESGRRLLCVSNWDVSLRAVLDRCGLAAALDDIVTSAEVGARKPDPAIFRVALDRARCEPQEAVHVGDTPGEDVAGAKAAGIPALLLDRDGGGDLASLAELLP